MPYFPRPALWRPQATRSARFEQLATWLHGTGRRSLVRENFKYYYGGNPDLSTSFPSSRRSSINLSLLALYFLYRLDHVITGPSAGVTGPFWAPTFLSSAHASNSSLPYHAKCRVQLEAPHFPVPRRMHYSVSFPGNWLHSTTSPTESVSAPVAFRDYGQSTRDAQACSKVVHTPRDPITQLPG